MQYIGLRIAVALVNVLIIQSPILIWTLIQNIRMWRLDQKEKKGKLTDVSYRWFGNIPQDIQKIEELRQNKILTEEELESKKAELNKKKKLVNLYQKLHQLNDLEEREVLSDCADKKELIRREIARVRGAYRKVNIYRKKRKWYGRYEGALIYIDGFRVGKLKPGEDGISFKVAPGRHSIYIRRYSYYFCSKRFYFNLEEGEELNLVFRYMIFRIKTIISKSPAGTEETDKAAEIV